VSHRRRLRVLYVTAALRGGGAERSLIELIRHLDRDEIEPHVCVLAPGAAAPDHQAVLHDIPLYCLGTGPGRRARAAGLLPLLIRIRPDIVHGRLLEPSLCARLGWFTGARVICEERSLAVARPAWATLANRLSKRLCSAVAANSAAVARRMHERDGFGLQQIRVIPGGIDTDHFCPNGAPTSFDFVSVARLERAKGVWDLLEAMAIVRAAHPSASLLLVGSGEEHYRVARAIRERGLRAAVTMAGETGDVVGELRKAPVFVLASHSEGQSNAIMEAMATGLAVVATDVGGSPELVTPGANGELVPARDPHALAAQMIAHLEHPDRARAYGAAGREQAVSHHDIRRAAQQYRDLYVSLVGRGSRRAEALTGVSQP